MGKSSAGYYSWKVTVRHSAQPIELNVIARSASHAIAVCCRMLGLDLATCKRTGQLFAERVTRITSSLSVLRQHRAKLQRHRKRAARGQRKTLFR